MGWAKSRTTEMPALLLPSGRHRRRHRAFIAVIAAFVLVVAVSGATFGPSLVRWLRLDPPSSSQPLAVPPTSSSSPTPTAETPEAITGPADDPSPSPSPTGSPSTPSTPPTKTRVAPVGTAMPDFEGEVLSQTNAARSQNKCGALKMDAHLLTAARLHSADMAANNFFNHNSQDGRSPGDRMKAAGYDTSLGWAENIAAGYPSPDRVMVAWLGSDGHRKNILNCSLKSIGIGVARATNGTLYWTQDFGGR